MKIASILPYKENYTKEGAGAVALWVKEFLKYSKYKKTTTVYGYTANKNYLSKNYKNIKIKTIDSKLYSTTKEYSQKLIYAVKEEKFDVIEIHNRPIMIDEFVDKIKSKVILYFHNDPITMKGAKTPTERKKLLRSVDKIVFISKWVKKKFFENLEIDNDSKTEIIYHSVNKLNKFNYKKKKHIIFVGKLNKSKGYDIFCASIKNILNKKHDWLAYSYGDEKRLQKFETHPRHKNIGQVSHSKVLKIFEQSEIAVIPSRWEEPFGRTALEASSRGCATIISNRGGLTETTDSALVLSKTNPKILSKKLNELINNKKLRRKLQINGFKNVKHNIVENSKKIDDMRSSLFPFSFFNTNDGKVRILNIYNLAQKLNHRIYNLSLGKKFTNGFIRNGHDVLEISDRDYVKQNKGFNFFNIKNRFHKYLIETFKNYNPDIIFFGHSDNINTEILNKFKLLNKNLIISQWNEDPLLKNLEGGVGNIQKLKNFLSIVDHTFVTTDPKSVSSFSNNKDIYFFMTPVDKNIECFDTYNLNPKNDIFYAMSHGVNRATLKDGKIDSRVSFLNKLISKIEDVKYDFYGYNKQEPIWSNDFYRALINCKMALNLSRGNPTKYYSSNRIASLMGNGLLTFIDDKVQMKDFFNKDEIIFYKNINELADQIKFYSKKDNLRKKIARKGKMKYFKLFNETRLSKYLVDISLGKNSSLL